MHSDDIWDWDPFPGDPPAKRGGEWPDSARLCKWVRKQTPTVLLAFSGGKDSVACWYALHQLDFKVIPFSLYPAPDLEIFEQMVTYYEDLFGTHIIRLPNRSVWRFLRYGVLQSPERLPVLAGAGIAEVPLPRIYFHVAKIAGVLEDEPWCATGLRVSDSIRRRINIMKDGPFRLQERVFYPAWDYSREDVVNAIEQLGVTLPVDYRLFGRTCDGLDYRFTEPLSRHFPGDYEKLKSLYGLIDVEFIRRGEIPPGIHDGQEAG